MMPVERGSHRLYQVNAVVKDNSYTLALISRASTQFMVPDGRPAFQTTRAHAISCDRKRLLPKPVIRIGQKNEREAKNSEINIQMEVPSICHGLDARSYYGDCLYTHHERRDRFE
jgi:hypothetical protein